MLLTITFPIDYFDGATPLGEYIKRLRAKEAQEVLREFAWIVGEARVIAWEGDMTAGPYVFFMPDPRDGHRNMLRGYAWKQGNDGLTFVVASEELPWLQEDESALWEHLPLVRGHGEKVRDAWKTRGGSQ